MNFSTCKSSSKDLKKAYQAALRREQDEGEQGEDEANESEESEEDIDDYDGPKGGLRIVR